MSLQVMYLDAPVGAQKEVVVTADTGQPFSQPQQLRDGAGDIPWATLETEGWILDGTRRLLPDMPNEMGWWSAEPSDATGRFSKPPVITVCFPQPYTASGLTFQFWPSLAHWCSEIRVLWYREQTLLAETTAYPDSAQWVLSYDVKDFDRIEICLLKTNMPGCFVKLQHIQIGQAMVFLRDELVQVRLLSQTDPSLCALPVDTMTVEIRERKGRTLLPKKNQTLQLYRDGMCIATHYITDASRESRQNYRFRSQSAIGQLEDSFLGGIYEAYPLAALLQEVLGDVPFSVHQYFSGEKVTGYLPVCTRRQALQQIAFAVGAATMTLGDGTIRLLPPENTVSDSFTADRIFAGGGMKREAPVASVELFVHSYAPGEEEKVLLKERNISGEGALFLFSEPYHSYQITGGILADSGANWVKLTANGPVTLTAKKYSHTVSVRTKINPLATAVDKGNAVTVEKATLIHPGNAEQVLARMYAYYTMQDLLSQQVVVSGQRVGQMVESLNPWGDPIAGHIIGMESTFTDGGHIASIQIRGREVAEE